MSMSSISPAAPQIEKTSESMFYVVSVKKMFALTVFSLGLYVLYWTYRNWATYKRATGDRVIPVLRTFFGVFFLYALLKRVDRGFCSSGLSHKWSPALLTLGMVGTLALSFVPHLMEPAMSSPHWLAEVSPREAIGRISMVYLVLFTVGGLQLWLMALIQEAINAHERDPFGENNDQLTLANWLWMLPGILFWGLMIFSWASLAFLVAHR